MGACIGEPKVSLFFNLGPGRANTKESLLHIQKD